MIYAEKMEVIFAFTNSSYFMWKGFTAAMEDDIFNSTWHEEITEGIPYNKDQWLEDYFQCSLLSMFEFEYSGGLNIILNDGDPSASFNMPDLKALFKKDFPVYVSLLKKNQKFSLTKNAGSFWFITW